MLITPRESLFFVAGEQNDSDNASHGCSHQTFCSLKVVNEVHLLQRYILF